MSNGASAQAAGRHVAMVADVAFLASVGKRVYNNYRALGWSQFDAMNKAGSMAIQWRILVRACLFTPVVLFLAILSAESMGDRWGNAAAFWTFAPGLILIPITAGIVYCKLIDHSLFERRFLYWVFAIPARPFRNVHLFWVMTIPWWPILGLSCLAMSPWLNTGPFAPGDLFG